MLYPVQLQLELEARDPISDYQQDMSWAARYYENLDNHIKAQESYINADQGFEKGYRV